MKNMENLVCRCKFKHVKPKFTLNRRIGYKQRIDFLLMLELCEIYIQNCYTVTASDQAK